MVSKAAQHFIDFQVKPSWSAMLQYTAMLHERCTHPNDAHFDYPWEEIGIGYHLGPAFGHWDIVHAVFDAIPFAPEHARHQLLNNLKHQLDNGFLPGSIWLKSGSPVWNTIVGHPPVWEVAVQDYCNHAGDDELIRSCYPRLKKQIEWFENNRRAEDEGFYYCDILNHRWESGVDEGVRFETVATGAYACVDATSHVYQMYVYAADWADRLFLVEERARFEEEAAKLKEFIRKRLFDETTGFFHDIWSVGHSQYRRLALEGIWPIVTGAASDEQALRVIDENLLSTERFLTAHPLSTVGVSDPGFELRMWRGPAWNSMTYWAARGCMRYNRPDAAALLLERALDCSAVQFERTGTIWEFYHPQGGKPEDLARKPSTEQNMPCRDYLGHNPLLAMARLWLEAREVSENYE